MKLKIFSALIILIIAGFIGVFAALPTHLKISFSVFITLLLSFLYHCIKEGQKQN